MLNRWLTVPGLTVVPLLIIACDAPSSGLSDVHCGIGEKVEKLQVGLSEVRVESRLEVDAKVQDALNPCLPSTRPLYSTFLRFEGEAPGKYDIHVRAPELFSVYLGNQTESSRGELQCEPVQCSVFSDDYVPCASIAGAETSDQGAGGDSSCEGDSSSESSFQHVVAFTVTNENVPTVRIVSEQPMTAKLRVVPWPSQE